jgi:hypothetical protein
MRFDRPPAGLENYQPLFDRARGLDDPARRAFALLDRRPGHLFAAEFVRAHPAPTDEFRELFFAHGPAGAARAEIGIILPALLQVEDRVTMAFGVESRVPLLDRRDCGTRPPRSCPRPWPGDATRWASPCHSTTGSGGRGVSSRGRS